MPEKSAEVGIKYQMQNIYILMQCISLWLQVKDQTLKRKKRGRLFIDLKVFITSLTLLLVSKIFELLSPERQIDANAERQNKVITFSTHVSLGMVS